MRSLKTLGGLIHGRGFEDSSMARWICKRHTKTLQKLSYFYMPLQGARVHQVFTKKKTAIQILKCDSDLKEAIKIFYNSTESTDNLIRYRQIDRQKDRQIVFICSKCFTVNKTKALRALNNVRVGTNIISIITN